MTTSIGNVHSNLLKSVCAQNFLCATFYQDSSIFRMTWVKYVPKHFFMENLRALQVSFCALITRPHMNSLQGTRSIDKNDFTHHKFTNRLLFIHSFRIFLKRLFKSTTTQRRSQLQQ